MNIWYKTDLKDYYKEVLDLSESDIKITQKENLAKLETEKAPKVEKPIVFPYARDEEWKKDKFDWFLMKCS